MMLATFIFLAFTLYLAQMGDKTQVLTIILATRTKKHLSLFLAIMTGFAIGVTLAVFIGEGLNEIIPHKTLEIISGAIFVLIGLILIKNGAKKEKKKIPLGNNFVSVAFLIFLSDLGDKTQIAITLFTTNYPSIIVWFAAMVALLLDTLIMIFFSKAIIKRLKENVIKKVAGVAFIVIGIYIFISHLQLS